MASAELYAIGVNRIIYKTQDFATGVTVTAHFWNPSLIKSALQTFTEIELGLYYLDYNFTLQGTYAALFYEDGVKKTPGTYRVTEIGGVVGPGALSCTWTQKDEEGVPLDNVAIWVSTDAEGLNVIAGTLHTNAQGEVTFMLDAQTVYVWRELAGFNFQNPKTWSVS